MKLKNKDTGDAEFMRYDPAVAAVQAGTHEFVSDGASAVEAEAETPEEDDAGGAVDPNDHTKDELIAIAAERDVEINESDTKAEIAEAINAA